MTVFDDPARSHDQKRDPLLINWMRKLGRPVPSVNFRAMEPSLTFQRILVLSSPADRIVLPSGLNCTSLTAPLCPVSVSFFCPLAISQTIRLPSCEAVTSEVLSGLKSSAVIGCVCPLKVSVWLCVALSQST